MPTLIASKDFIDTLFVYSDSNEVARDLFSFIINDFFGYKLICDFETIEEYIAATKDNPIWEYILDRNSGVEFKKNLEEDVEDDLFYKGLDEQNLFLLSGCEQKCMGLMKEKGYIFIPAENLSTWERILKIKKNGKFKVTKNEIIPEENKFNNWSKLNDFTLPTTGIIIFDRFIFSDKDNQKMADNLFGILEIICKNGLTGKLDLTIISEFLNDQAVTDAYNKVNAFLLSRKLKNVKLNVLRHHKSIYPKDMEGLHYRTIWTNYLKYKCDDSFNFFKGNGKVNNDADLHITFNLENRNRAFLLKELNDIKRYIANLKNYGAEVLVERKLFYFKDKENCLLT